MSATIVTIITGILGLAMVAVLVSQASQTQAVLQGAGSLASSIIGAAVAPVTGYQGNNFGSSGSIPGSINVTPNQFYA